MEKIKDWFKKWCKFKFKEYIDDFKNIKWGLIFVLCTLLYAFSNDIFNYLYSIICNYVPFPSNYSGKYWPIIAIVSILFFSISRIKEIIKFHLFPPLIALLVIIFPIILIEFIDDTYSPFYFLKSNQWYSLNIYTILFFSFLHIIPYKSYIELDPPAKNEYSLFDDSSEIETKDLYLREKFIADLVKHLNNTETKTSFSIGIIGEWGTGKTNVIERIMDQLENDPQNIIININPWQQNGISYTITTFFDTLKDKFTFQSNSISKHINRYYKNIIKENYSNDFVNLFSHILRLNQKGTNEHQIINDLIKISNKKIFVFIDDVDRLTSSEIIETFSFIRNTANFNNTFFIVPYDKNYIINVLTNSKQFDNEREYLNKIFQLEIHLPQFKKSFYLDLLKEYLTLCESSQERVDKINYTLDKIVRQTKVSSVEFHSPKTEHTNIFESLIDNIRELKRFCNSLKIIMTSVGDEADLFDLILLELIKNKNFELYAAIRTKKIIAIETYNQTETYRVKSMDLDELLKNNPFNISLTYAVKLLLGESTTKNSRSFLYPRNFYIYFSYQLFDKISLKDFENLTKSNEKEVIKILSIWLKNPRENEELYTIISDINFTSDFNFFKILNSSILQLNHVVSKDYKWLELIKNRIIHNSYIENLNFSIKKPFEKHVIELLKNKNTNPYFKAQILCEIHFQNPIFLKDLSSKNILDFVESLFLNYSKSKFVTFEQCNKFYMLLKDERNGKIIPNSRLCKIYKSILEKDHKTFQDYIIHFLRNDDSKSNWSLNAPTKINIYFDPWFKYIFKDVEIFKKMVLKLDSKESEEINCIKRIISSNIDQYKFENPHPIEILDETDIQILRKHLRNIKY